MITCSRCKSSRDLHLISILDEIEIGSHDRGSGRLLVYCIVCVNECRGNLYLNIPLATITSDLIEFLYKFNYTRSDPDIFINQILGASDQRFALNDITFLDAHEIVERLRRHVQ